MEEDLLVAVSVPRAFIEEFIHFLVFSWLSSDKKAFLQLKHLHYTKFFINTTIRRYENYDETIDYLSDCLGHKLSTQAA